MDGQQKLFAVFWVCCTVAIASVAGAVAWYNVRAAETIIRVPVSPPPADEAQAEKGI